MEDTRTMPCPNCGGEIHYRSDLLMMGTSFSCSNCGASVSISQDSLATARTAYKEFEKIKENK